MVFNRSEGSLSGFVGNRRDPVSILAAGLDRVLCILLGQREGIPVVSFRSFRISYAVQLLIYVVGPGSIIDVAVHKADPSRGGIVGNLGAAPRYARRESLLVVTVGQDEPESVNLHIIRIDFGNRIGECP